MLLIYLSNFMLGKDKNVSVDSSSVYDFTILTLRADVLSARSARINRIVKVVDLSQNQKYPSKKHLLISKQSLHWQTQIFPGY